jgi:hypothetical protein
MARQWRQRGFETSLPNPVSRPQPDDVRRPNIEMHCGGSPVLTRFEKMTMRA